VRHRPPSPRLTSPHVWRSSRTEGLQELMSQVSSGESLYHHLHCLWVPITTARRFHLPLGQLGCHTPHRIALVLHLTDNRLKPLRTVQGLAASVVRCTSSEVLKEARHSRGGGNRASASIWGTLARELPSNRAVVLTPADGCCFIRACTPLSARVERHANGSIPCRVRAIAWASSL
jgi:hypothetical protein